MLSPVRGVTACPADTLRLLALLHPYESDLRAYLHLWYDALNASDSIRPHLLACADAELRASAGNNPAAWLEQASARDGGLMGQHIK